MQCDSPDLPAAKKSKTQAEDNENKVYTYMLYFPGVSGLEKRSVLLSGTNGFNLQGQVIFNFHLPDHSTNYGLMDDAQGKLSTNCM